jgi:hypothetical protein
MPDLILCTLCEKPLEDGQPVQFDINGEGAHVECLQTLEEEEHDDE